MSDLVTIRASSWADLMDCPMRWKAKNLLGVRMPTSGAAWLGTILHYSTAVFDQSRLDGNPVTIDDAAGELVAKLYDTEEEDIDWEDKSPRKVEPIALRLHTRYCSDIAPKREYAGVEVRCEALDVQVPGQNVTVRLTGSTDRVRKTADGNKGISDIKSGGRAVGADGAAVTKGHHLQVAIYEILAEYALGEPINAPAEVIGLCTSSTARVGTAEIEAPRLALLGTEEQPGLIDIAARMYAADIWPGNPRSMLCSGKYCPIYSSCIYKG